MSAHTNVTATKTALSYHLLKGVLFQHLTRSIHVKESRGNMDPLVTRHKSNMTNILGMSIETAE
jgi:hypothetical protein